MKPIRLEVQGLQSYVEPVAIDFEALGRYGLFGIFGPIGSGKSSLLDALTLALYGLVDRVAGRSKKGVINADASRMEVRLTFSVRTPEGVAEVFEVHRSYRSTRDDGGVQRIASRLVQHSEGGVPCEPPLVLADKEREVNDSVAAIVGLCAEDFMRAVVLPQGRFRDVLHLKGSERRGMLQRIFRLSAYGAHLRQRLRGRQQAQRERLAAIDGELQGLGQATRADVRAARKQREASRVEREQAAASLQDARQHHDAAARSRRQHAQLTEARGQLEALALAGPAMLELHAQVQQADALLPQRGPLGRWQRARQRGEAAAARERKAAEHLAAVRRALDASEEHLDAVRTRHDAEAPSQAHRLRGFEEVARRLATHADLEALVAQARRRCTDARARRQQLDDLLTEARAELASLEPQRRSTKRRLAKVRVQLEERRHVAEAVEAHRALAAAREAHERSVEAQHRAEDSLARCREREREAAAEAERIRERLAALEAELAELPERAATGSSLELGSERIDALAAAITRYQEAQQALEEAQRQEHRAEVLQQQAMSALADAERTQARALDAHRLHVAAHAAGQLAADLEEEEPCPVCGSELHPSPAPPSEAPAAAPESDEHAQAMRQDAMSATASLATARARVEAAATRAESTRGDVDRVAAALREWLGASRSLEPEAVLTAARQALHAQIAEVAEAAQRTERRAQLVASVQGVRLEVERALAPVGAAEASSQRAMSDLEQATLDVDAASATVGQAWSRWSEVAGERTTLFDVPQLQARLDGRDAEARELERSLTEAELRREQLQQAIADAQQERGGAVTDIAEADAQRERLEERLQSLRNDTASVLATGPVEPTTLAEVTDSDEPSPTLAELAEAVEAQQAALAQGHRELVAALEGAISAREEAQRSHGAATTEAATAAEALAGARSTLSDAWAEWRDVAAELADHGETPGTVGPLGDELQGELDALAARIDAAPSAEQIRTWRGELTAHREQQQRLEATVEALTDGTPEPPSHEAFAALQEALVQAEARAEAAAEHATRSEAAHDDLVKRLARVEALQQDREAAAGELDRLDHLGGLLRGDRFVEFVANDLLRELAATATQHLHTLSEGRYALVLDDQGGFLVQDADAGGTTRPVTSLSGGESFLSALALALALSTQIQARGAKPLEFFFLDEGFGSLDPEALDRVMSAIERLKDGHRVIGLISHLPGVRERIPMHLVVHPAGTRQQGSAVELRIQ